MLEAVNTTPSVHLCFGNNGGQSIQKGTLAKDGISQRAKCDHIVMETAHRPSEELAVFRDLDPRIGLGWALSTSKTEIESADTVARAIAAARKWSATADHLRPSDCGFWMLKRSIADESPRAVAGRDLFEGRASAARRRSRRCKFFKARVCEPSMRRRVHASSLRIAVLRISCNATSYTGVEHVPETVDDTVYIYARACAPGIAIKRRIWRAGKSRKWPRRATPRRSI